MKIITILFVFQLFIFYNLQSQEARVIPDLTKINDKDIWEVYNRKIVVDTVVHLNAKKGHGILWYKDLNFSNGTIEVDIKGKDVRARSFLGIAFHGLNDSVYDAIYFRPFNFRSPERNGHSVQYISSPDYEWHVLRKKYPGDYENPVNPMPDPNEWFHVTIKVNYPQVKVYVDNSKETSLEIEQLSDRKKGWIGFWVGNMSDGSYKNLKIISN